MIPDPETVAAILKETADAEILPRFKTLERHEITEKASGDLVTAADHAAEAVLTLRLKDIAPGALIIGEEAHEKAPQALAELAAAPEAWIIDPVDGTHNFAHGVPRFAVIVAYCRRGETAMGWILNPVSGEEAVGEHGGGVRIDGAPARASEAKAIREMTGSLGPRLAERLQAARGQEKPAGITRYRTVGLEYMDLARGKLDFARYGGRLMPWDHAAGVLLHREAGGYAALASDGSGYTPGLRRPGDALLLAPDRHCWEALRALTRG